MDCSSVQLGVMLRHVFFACLPEYYLGQPMEEWGVLRGVADKIVSGLASNSNFESQSTTKGDVGNANHNT